ncbi:uncharacterized protein LOC126998242 [Eriocheir sinensis]|uniref:uncharacterized protein LOC126998234 n=1 Tax=Eriocheir sinensis TaxID=95602 RepID=UPI0021C82AD6|nr:uncharacterized protein LOC126998234 [Eriocheir sinensis]XP_050715675.1 uncharacterized protein LOC126998234 [Eriocheir sinensis]XP_050715687.1 uncharacterized protein LOC126998242 [Eriocheir sinensis]XP_050715688.1 uncharacterized protein LOC126998242 [Eriocheir sinensis]
MGGPSNSSLRKAPTTPRHPDNTAPRPDYWVLLYVPNLIGYIRLSLLLLAFCLLHSSSPAWFVSFYTGSIVLDGFDGFAARKLHQCSLFGAWFDVVLDNLSRGLLWTHIHPLLYLVSALEWTTFCCNYILGAEWQQTFTQGKKKGFSYFISLLMAQNWRNPLGVLVILGLHVFPLWLFGIQHGIFASHLTFVPSSVQVAGLVVLGCGRVLCGIVEVWCVASHTRRLLVNSSPR